MARLASAPAEMARRGFLHGQQAAADLDALLGELEPGPAEPPELSAWLDLFERASDPDIALGSLRDLVACDGQQVLQVLAEPDALLRLVLVLGGSHALGQHLRRCPADVEVLLADPVEWTPSDIRRDVLTRIGADPDEATPVAADSDAADRLRCANRRHLVRIAARDLSALEPESVLESVAFELAGLADALIEGALAVARAGVPDHADARLAIIGLGKGGAQELNYISDIDVVFVAEPARDDVSHERAISIATRLAASLTRICSAHTGAGSIWQVDAALRPEGKAGQLVRGLDSMRTYYEKWASNWEFQAMLKARPMAGDLDLGREYLDIVAPMVWRAGERPHFVNESQAMRKRVVSLIPSREQGREIKLGAGGLRDVEFTVQLLQLVHGRADDRLRTRATLPSLRELSDLGYIGRGDALELGTAYRFQRTLEHRIQLWNLRRTHLLPDDEVMLRRLGRGLGIRPHASDDVRPGDADAVTEQFHASTRRVLRLHERVFYSPLLEAVARIPSTEMRLSTDAARDRLKALGFADPAAALRHIEALTNGSTRSVEIQRQLLPVLLSWFAEGENPDFALLSFRQVSEALGSSPWYLRALRDEGLMAQRLARVLSSSRYAVDLMRRAPEAIQLLGSDDELRPRTRAQLVAPMLRTASRHEDADQAIAAVRAYRRRELFRIAAGDILELTSLAEVGQALTELASATIDAALSIASRGVENPPRLGVVAMGRWGGQEMGYGSDCDAMFVIADPEPGEPADPDALRKAGVIVGRLRKLLGAPGPDPALEIDVDLRPEGKGGPLVRTLSSYLAYYERWSSTWESQALIRAAHGAGDEQVVGALLDAVDRLRWPAGGPTRAQVAEIRKLKARMESERMPRGTDPKRNTKLGPGGLSDVEWTVQLLQLRHAHDEPDLRTTSTLPAIEAASGHGLVDQMDAAALAHAWRLASRLRNAIMLARGRASDAIPADARDLAAVAHLLGYAPGEATQLLDDHRRATRHAQKVVDRLFWDDSA